MIWLGCRWKLMVWYGRKLRNGSINYSKGMQHYLNYCKRNGVTVELLRKERQYDGMDVMKLYDKSAFKEKPSQEQER